MTAIGLFTLIGASCGGLIGGISGAILQIAKRSDHSDYSAIAKAAPTVLPVVPSLASDPSIARSGSESSKQRTVPVFPLPSVSHPIVIKVNLYPWRTLSIRNEGKSSIEDLSAVFAEFSFNEAAYLQKSIQIESASFPSGPIPLKARIEPGHQFDVEIKRFLFHRIPFEEFLKNQGIIPTEYVARVTFRDSQTGQKYACYKVFSSVDGMPEEWGDMVGTGGGYHEVFTSTIPQVLVDAMKPHYSDGAINHECER